MIELSRSTPLAIGHLRAIHAHPDRADLLVKVMRAEAVAKRYDAPGQWLKRLPRVRQYGSFLREIKEYLAAHARFARADPPLVRIAGLVETDLGLGLVCEKIVAADGSLAPTLHALYRREGKAPAWAAAALERFLDEALRHDLIVGDLHAGNLVYGNDARGGPPRLLLVDGFGEKSLIPLGSMSRAINRRNTLRRYRRMLGHLAVPVSEWLPERTDP